MGDAVLENHSSSCYNCDQWRVRKMRGGWKGRRRRNSEEGTRGVAEEDCEKLSCVTVILVDSWSALFHRSPYCLLGGLSGRKQVSVQIALENNISETLSLCVIWWPSSMVTPHFPGLGPCDGAIASYLHWNLDDVSCKKMGERINQSEMLIKKTVSSFVKFFLVVQHWGKCFLSCQESDEKISVHLS